MADRQSRRSQRDGTGSEKPRLSANGGNSQAVDGQSRLSQPQSRYSQSRMTENLDNGAYEGGDDDGDQDGANSYQYSGDEDFESKIVAPKSKKSHNSFLKSMKLYRHKQMMPLPGNPHTDSYDSGVPDWRTEGDRIWPEDAVSVHSSHASTVIDFADFEPASVYEFDPNGSYASHFSSAHSQYDDEEDDYYSQDGGYSQNGTPQDGAYDNGGGGGSRRTRANSTRLSPIKNL